MLTLISFVSIFWV